MRPTLAFPVSHLLACACEMVNRSAGLRLRGMYKASEKEDLQHPVRRTGTNGELEEKEERMQKGLRVRRLMNHLLLAV